MTRNVINALAELKELSLFEEQELYFVGGTALSYYLEHRISEDIDLISPTKLDHRAINTTMLVLGAHKVADKNAAALRMVGLIPDEYMMKFDYRGVKVEFFVATQPSQLAILSACDLSAYLNSNLKILDVKSIAKLKLIAFINRMKGRDLFDFGVIMQHKVLTPEEILAAFQQQGKANSYNEISNFINQLKRPAEDEAVYLTEADPSPIPYDILQRDLAKIFEISFSS